MKSNATAHWMGTLKEGRGIIATASGALRDVDYGFNTRFEGESGVNPEELIAAAHASCFSMALSKELGEADIQAQDIRTRAEVTLNTDSNDIAITAVHLDVEVLASANKEAIEDAAESAKENCPVSKVLNADISMDISCRSE